MQCELPLPSVHCAFPDTMARTLKLPAKAYPLSVRFLPSSTLPAEPVKRSTQYVSRRLILTSGGEACVCVLTTPALLSFTRTLVAGVLLPAYLSRGLLACPLS